MRRLIDQTAWI